MYANEANLERTVLPARHLGSIAHLVLCGERSARKAAAFNHAKVENRTFGLGALHEMVEAPIKEIVDIVKRAADLVFDTVLNTHDV
jgi:hypothetical protein